MTGLYEDSGARAEIPEGSPGPVSGPDRSGDPDRMSRKAADREGQDREMAGREAAEEPPTAGARRAGPRAALAFGEDEVGTMPLPEPAPRPRGFGGQSTALRASIALGAVAVLGGLYVFTPVFSGPTPVRPEPIANPLTAAQRIGTGLMVAAAVPADDGIEDPLLAAAAPDVSLLPDIESRNGDIDGLLARLDERQARLDALTEELNDALRALDIARNDAERLEAEIKAVRKQAATERKTHEAEMRRLASQHEADAARAVAEALERMPRQNPQVEGPGGLSPEERRLVEERRRLRAAQLRSKSIVYDDVTN